MNRLYILAVASLLSCAVFANGTYRVGDFSRSQIDVLKKISGTYVNAKQDSMKVNFDFLDDGAQPDLFGPREFEFYGEYESSTANDESYMFDLDSFEKISANEFRFSDSINDCDYPGCANYEVAFTFKKNRKGTFFATIDISVEVDVEESLPSIFEDNQDLDHDELSALLDEGCKNIYGRDAFLIDFVDDYKYSVYCGYTKKVYLKKIK